jgi:hypothetical protein
MFGYQWPISKASSANEKNAQHRAGVYTSQEKARESKTQNYDESIDGTRDNQPTVKNILLLSL